jgi:hypothetical protein
VALRTQRGDIRLSCWLGLRFPRNSSIASDRA